jgi:talin
MKTILIDESKPTYEVVAKVCEHIGLSNPEEYSFLAESSVVFLTKEEAARVKKKSGDQKAEEGTFSIILSGLYLCVFLALKWLNPDKTMPEQGLEDVDVVVLKKKFFYSDQNIDRNDAIQVNLVFVQCRDMIVSGKVPCKLDEATQLAALQCQTQFGNHEPDKRKAVFIKYPFKSIIRHNNL